MPWFESGKPLHNWMLHETDLYYSSSAGNADLGRLQAQFDEYYELLEWQRDREVIWSKVLTGLQVPIYLTIHGTGVGEPGAGRWLDSKTFVFNESVVANEEGMRQLEFILNGLGIELITTHSPGWVESIGDGNIGTSHADMFLMVFSESHRFAIAGLHCATLELVRDQPDAGAATA